MFIIQYRKFFYALSGILVALSLFVIFYKGLPLGIEFTGGSLLEVSYPATHTVGGKTAPQTRPQASAVQQYFTSHVASAEREKIGDLLIQPVGKEGFVVRTKKIEESDRQVLLQTLSLGGAVDVHQERFNFIGPTIGSELSTKSAYAIGIVLLAIILFIAYAFRQVSEPVSSWKYGVIAVTVLLHDILIPTGVFAFLGLVAGFEINILFVTALLAVLGYSVHDTIIVFDRVRENLRLHTEGKKGHAKYTSESFSDVVGDSLRQVITRSINTSLTAILAILVYYFFGGASTQNFALTLALGIFVGTYSSICVATPLLITVQKFQEKKALAEKTKKA
ncbi:MAG TPA: protein translocase subunit SecF [Candidatus Paceibacterota bacterium]|nr:protein translocase subunit SecF [Candidatus Paceibacterota bacterium]